MLFLFEEFLGMMLNYRRAHCIIDYKGFRFHPCHCFSSVPADMPLYDILNEFQKGSSHMAAVVKPKGESKRPPSILEKSEGNEPTNGDSDITTPLLTNKEDKSNTVVVDIDKVSKPASKANLAYNEAVLQGLVAPDESEDGEVIGIITLEDVFEELLQVEN